MNTRLTQKQKLSSHSRNNFFNYNDKIYGKDFGYWIVKFWNTFGRNSESKSELPVYCMSGLVEGADQFTIPQDKAILFCPMKYIAAIPKSKFDSKMRKEMLDRCKYEMDIIEDLNMFIDDELVSPYCTRMKSPFFTLENKYMALTDGYWLMLKPNSLDKGSHHINMFSSCSAGKIQIASDYQVRVV